MITFDGFIDTYYAYDFQAPKNNERVYTTQPQRHNEPSINLIMGALSFEKNKFRGRLALQAGNSVEANYANEANPDLGYIQEGYIGYQLGEKTWIDAGIYLGHIGMESWISKYNYTYSRSLMLDNVPYYATGVRIQHTIDSKNYLEVHFLNGWQNISETNSGKSIGFQWKHKISDVTTFTYNNFFGDENVVTGYKARFRTYHDFILETRLNETWQVQGSIDIGSQTQQENDGTDLWGAAAVSFRQKLAENHFLAYRGEYYLDPHQANVGTGTPNGYQIIAASMNYDVHFPYGVLWRNEVRGFYSKDKIYPVGKTHTGHIDSYVVTSLGVSF